MITLIVHTKNEEKNIRKCILSAEKIASEVVVVDMSSSDRTVEIARKAGATVYSVPDDFVDNIRGCWVNKAKCEWILVLDADERLTKNLARKISAIVKKNEYDVVMIPHKNIRLKKWMKHTGYWPDYHPRLFRKGFVKWPQRVDKPHVPRKIIGRVLTIEAKEENAILHYSLESIKQLLLKYLRYYSLKGGGDFFKKNKTTPLDLINYYEGEFKWRYIEQRGYLDGMRGFVFAKFREFSKFLEFVHWWESEGYPEVYNQSDLLNTILEKNKQELLSEYQSSKFFKMWQYLKKQKYRLLMLKESCR